jgi:hypothetical protein
VAKNVGVSVGLPARVSAPALQRETMIKGLAGLTDKQIREFALPGSTIELSVPGSFWDLTCCGAHASYFGRVSRHES